MEPPLIQEDVDYVPEVGYPTVGIYDGYYYPGVDWSACLGDLYYTGSYCYGGQLYSAGWVNGCYYPAGYYCSRQNIQRNCGNRVQCDARGRPTGYGTQRGSGNRQGGQASPSRAQTETSRANGSSSRSMNGSGTQGSGQSGRNLTGYSRPTQGRTVAQAPFSTRPGCTPTYSSPCSGFPAAAPRISGQSPTTRSGGYAPRAAPSRQGGAVRAPQGRGVR